MKFSYLKSFFKKQPKTSNQSEPDLSKKKIIGGRFEKINVLSNGGAFGKVYLCKDLNTDNVVAVKVIKDEERFNQKMFEHEIGAMASIKSINVVNLVCYGY